MTVVWSPEVHYIFGMTSTGSVDRQYARVTRYQHGNCTSTLRRLGRTVEVVSGHIRGNHQNLLVRPSGDMATGKLQSCCGTVASLFQLDISYCTWQTQQAMNIDTSRLGLINTGFSSEKQRVDIIAVTGVQHALRSFCCQCDDVFVVFGDCYFVLADTARKLAGINIMSRSQFIHREITVRNIKTDIVYADLIHS